MTEPQSWVGTSWKMYKTLAEADREVGRATEVLAMQVRAALSGLEGALKSARVLLAYEPVWAIGEGGISATSDYADARHAEIAVVAVEVLGRKVPCLYGGWLKTAPN